jgi:hypothetical protein
MDQDFFIRTKPDVRVDVDLTGRDRHGRQKLRLQQTTAIPQSFLDARAEERKRATRAPLGDSHGAYQKIAEIPLALLFAKIPPNAWNDQAALRKLLNDPDIRAFRSDGDHRRF